LAESGGDADFAAYPENHRFQVPAAAHWREVRREATNVGRALQTAMRALETANPDKLYGIFGDAQWTNKDRLSDAMLRDLVEHFSSLELTLAALPEDELGQGYEFLIKKFADDSGHTAAQFYTNRTVVHLMTELLEPQPSESIYDPTCGSGGMLLSCITHLRRLGKKWRNVRLYGQELNLMTSSIARMNCFLHGVEDFDIVRGDTLSAPKFVEGDRLKRFDVVLANPPYSIKQWDRTAFASDPWGRNLYGTPPQGRADYAFWQHILCSLTPKSGRCAILFPHGVLFRQEEAEMRRKLLEADLVEAIIGLGPNLFYNSPMEACVVVCHATKSKARRGRVLLINAVNEVTREQAQSFLADAHLERIAGAFRQFKDQAGLCRVVTLEEVRAQHGNLSIPLYVAPGPTNGSASVTAQTRWPLAAGLSAWLRCRAEVAKALKQVVPALVPPKLEVRACTAAACELLTDRDKWTRVRFGEVVALSKETERDPAGAGIGRLIGMEHLEPGSLHVRAWGNVADGTTFTRRCRPGQVLFGRRRAYQRKVGVAEFDAVVSGDIYVFAPKGDRLLPELLPFLCLSERFFQHAVGTSAGSLSPRTNWSSLASFEFDLPTLDQQRRIAETLWAVDDAVQLYTTITQDAQTLLESGLVEFLYGSQLWETSECAAILEDGPRNGFSPPANADGSGLPTLSISAIRGGEVVTDGSVKFAKVAGVDVTQFLLEPGDMLVVRGNGNRFMCGKAGLVREYPECCFYPDLLIRLRFKPEVMLQEFAVVQWNEPRTHLRLISKAKSTNGIWKINGQDIRSHRLVTPPLEAQHLFLRRVQPKRALVQMLNATVSGLTALRQSFLDAIIGDCS